MHRSSPLPLRRAAAAFLLLAVGLFAAPAAGSTGDTTFQAEGDETVHDITFPLPDGSGYYYSDTYYAGRSGGRVHRATDVMADKMVPVHAVVAGEIVYAPGADGASEPRYGYMIRLAGDDGMFYSYVHLNNDTPGSDDGVGGPENAYAPGIEEGARVERGQHIGWVGDSGNAESTAPHLHFEIGEDSRFEVRHNPYTSLLAAEERDDYPGDVAPAPPGTTGEEADEDREDGAPTSYTRLSGETRLETAVALSQETRQSARAVVVVPADSHVEALIASPLAGLIDAPILLSGPAGLSDGVIDEIRRIRPASAYVVGTTAQLSSAVEQDLADAGVANRARLQADDRYELSALVAEEIRSYPEVAGLDEVILALGDAAESSRAWPDALSATALAAETITPILLVRGDALPDAVADLLTAERPDTITVVGGTAAISDDVVQEAAAVADADARRLAGGTRYATSVAVAEAAVLAGLDAAAVWIATGRNFPDALAAGPAAAMAGSPLVLVDGQDADGSPPSNEWLLDHAGELVVVGGENAISDAVAGGLTR